MKKPKPFTNVTVKPSLGTLDLLLECQDLIGDDLAGRRQPDYAVVHRAVAELRDRLRTEKAMQP